MEIRPRGVIISPIMENTIQKKIDSFFGQFPLTKFKKGESMLSAGSDPSGVFFLQKGFVRQFLFTLDGSELTLHFFKSGSYFPLFWAINDLPNRFNYQTLTNAEVRIASKEKFLELINNDPGILRNITSRLLFGLDGLLTRVESLASRNARQRTIGIIHFLGKHFGSLKGNSLCLTHPFTHEDISNLTGLTRETTSRELEHLSKTGLIVVKNRLIQVPDIRKLR